MGDHASEALAEGFLPGEPQTYDAISKRKNVPLSTLNHRAHGRPSIEQKAKANNTSLRQKRKLSKSI
jgi:hypothetical protein